MPHDRWPELAASADGGPVTVLRLPPARSTALVETGNGEPFEPMEGRRMNGWIVVAPAADWNTLAAEAQAHVESQQKQLRAGGWSPPTG
jgi:hypothetical protein